MEVFFKSNIIFFFDFFNVYDSYVEVFIMNGKLEMGVKNFWKVVKFVEVYKDFNMDFFKENLVKVE